MDRTLSLAIGLIVLLGVAAVFVLPGVMLAEQGYRIGGLQVGILLGLLFGSGVYDDGPITSERERLAFIRDAEFTINWTLKAAAVLAIVSFLVSGTTAAGAAGVVGVLLGIAFQAHRKMPK